MEESFGLVNIYCHHPYCKSFSSYVKTDSHLLGMYYPSQSGTGFLLYDTFTGISIRGVSIGEILMYKYINEVRTSKYQVITDKLRERFMCISLEEVRDRRRRIQKCLLNMRKKKHPLSSFSHLLGKETVYKRETEGSNNAILDTFFLSLHKDLYKILSSLSMNGITLNTLYSTDVESKHKTCMCPQFLQSLKDDVNYLTISRDEIDLGDEDFQKVIVVRYIKREESFEVYDNTVVVKIDSSSSDFTFLSTVTLKGLLKYISSTNINSFKSLEKYVVDELSRR